MRSLRCILGALAVMPAVAFAQPRGPRSYSLAPAHRFPIQTAAAQQSQSRRLGGVPVRAGAGVMRRAVAAGRNGARASGRARNGPVHHSSTASF